MKKIKLKDIASVRFGLNGKSNDEFDIPFITARNITNEGEIDWTSVHNINSGIVKEKDYVRNGEVMFAAKGHRNKAIAWQGENYIITASSTFMIITLDTTEILPEYLALFLESKKAKNHFSKHTRETTIPTIKKGVLLDLEVEIPNTQKQEVTIELNKLMIIEGKLMMEMKSKKEGLISAIINEKENA